MKPLFRVKALAFTPVAIATFTCAWLADAQDVSATMPAAQVSETQAVEAGVSPTAVTAEGLAFETVDPVKSTLLPMWPEAGKAPDMKLLEYVGVAEGAQALLADKYEKWLGYLDSKSESKTLPQNLLQANGCVEPCGMNKALLFVDTDDRKVFVAMVENGHVLMRPSLMSWPDESIAPLKKWLAADEDDAEKAAESVK
ncbi:MAG: hypothetical protein DI628_02105 [Blastochloris viridis]|uniref:Uncharacterized protein n=1 Tax=Blastochloris viridis TaxID=1079 RepID=A0A6N4R323_BLAVI|nr:MAG: hypothetical protein DI628_02105 [Blastochloris viridis]